MDVQDGLFRGMKCGKTSQRLTSRATSLDLDQWSNMKEQKMASRERLRGKHPRRRWGSSYGWWNM